MAWLSGWSYRKEITITGQSGAGTNYQVDFSIGDSAGGDFHLEGHCTNFPQDIEVTDNDETTLLKFWIEDITADPLKMTVKVADDLGSNQTIYIYYGKSGATTNSSIDDTFLFGDEFGSTLDSSKWTTEQGDIATSGGELQLLGTTGTRGRIIQNSANYSHVSPGHAIESKGYGTSDVDNIHYHGFGSSGFANFIDFSGDITPDDVKAKTYDGTVTTTDLNDVGIASSHIWKIEWYSGNTKFYKDNGILASHTANVPTGSLGAIFYEGNVATNNYYVDWVFIRKFVATEPAFSSAGSEETLPTGATIPVFNHLYNQMRA